MLYYSKSVIKNRLAFYRNTDMLQINTRKKNCIAFYCTNIAPFENVQDNVFRTWIYDHLQNELEPLT